MSVYINYSCGYMYVTTTSILVLRQTRVQSLFNITDKHTHTVDHLWSAKESALGVTVISQDHDLRNAN